MNNPFNDKINKAVAEAARKVMEQTKKAEQIDEAKLSFVDDHDKTLYHKTHEQALKHVRNLHKRHGAEAVEDHYHENNENYQSADGMRGVREGNPNAIRHRAHMDAAEKVLGRKPRTRNVNWAAIDKAAKKQGMKHVATAVGGKVMEQTVAEGYAEDKKNAPFEGGHKAKKVNKDQFGNVVKNRARHLAKKGMAAAMTKEEVEQLDELNPQTYINYSKKRFGNSPEEQENNQRGKDKKGEGTIRASMHRVERLYNKQIPPSRWTIAGSPPVRNEEAEQDSGEFVLRKGVRGEGSNFSDLQGTHHGVNVKPVYTSRKEAQKHADQINRGRGYDPERDKDRALTRGVLYQVFPRIRKEEVEQVDESKVTASAPVSSTSDWRNSASYNNHFHDKKAAEKAAEHLKNHTKDGNYSVIPHPDGMIGYRITHAYRRQADVNKTMRNLGPILHREEAEHMDESRRWNPDGSPKNVGLKAAKKFGKEQDRKTALHHFAKGAAEDDLSRFKKKETSHIAERLTGKQKKHLDLMPPFGKLTKKDFEAVRSKAKMMKESVQTLMEDTTPALSAAMKAILADAFHMYFKAHTFHWNVEGANFPEYHKFFGDVYEQLFDTIDPIAEEIRALGEYAPRSLTELKGSTSIDDSSVQTPAEMFGSLLADNSKILAGLTNGYKVAEAAGEIGLSNFLQDKIDAHKKLGWMIKSVSKGA